MWSFVCVHFTGDFVTLRFVISGFAPLYISLNFGGAEEYPLLSGFHFVKFSISVYIEFLPF